MELNNERNTRWIVDPKSPEGVRECEVLSVETGYTNGIYGMLGYVIFDLLYENYPETKTVRCMNKQKRIVNTEEDYIMWENEAHYRKEDALLAYKAYCAIKELEEQRKC